METNFQIRFGSEDSCSYSYFKTAETDIDKIKAIAKIEIQRDNKRFNDMNAFRIFPTSGYRNGSKLVREYCMETKGVKEEGILFKI